MLLFKAIENLKNTKQDQKGFRELKLDGTKFISTESLAKIKGGSGIIIEQDISGG